MIISSPKNHFLYLLHGLKGLNPGKEVISLDENTTVISPADSKKKKPKCPPKNRCDDLGMWIADSALEFEDSLAKYLKCQCKTIKKLLCEGKEDMIVPVLRSFKEILEQVCCIEKKLIYKLDKGICIGPCDKDKEC